MSHMNEAAPNREVVLGPSADADTQRGSATNVADVLAEMQRRLDHKPRRRASYSTFSEHLDLVPQVECVSGLKMSVQASAFHYCSPRESEGPWFAVEVGFPSRRVAALRKWAEDPKRLTKTVYAWVPIEVVAQVIADHGGFKPTTASSVGTDDRNAGGSETQ